MVPYGTMRFSFFSYSQVVLKLVKHSYSLTGNEGTSRIGIPGATRLPLNGCSVTLASG